MMPWLILMFLLTLDFMSLGGYLLLVMMAAYLVFHLRELSFRAAEIFLFVFGVEYFLFDFLWNRSLSLSNLCNYLAAPWLLYWMGRSMTCRCKCSRFPLKAATFLSLGLFTYGLLCVFYSLYVAPPAVGSRLMYKFWDHTPLSVTSGGLIFSMATGLAVGQLTSKNRLLPRLFWLGVLGMCLFFAFTWAHRTTIYIIAILAVYNYLAYLLAMNTATVRKTLLVTGSVLLAAAAIVCLALDVGGCYTWIRSQWLYQRLTDPAAANSTDRFYIWGNFFRQWLQYPLGGRQFRLASSYAHNLWLDVYYLCGILPFIPLVIATVIIIRHFFQYRTMQTARQDHRSAHILANYYIAAFLAFMVEPVISAYPYVFLAFILVSGCVEGAVLSARPEP